LPFNFFIHHFLYGGFDPHSSFLFLSSSAQDAVGNLDSLTTHGRQLELDIEHEEPAVMSLESRRNCAQSDYISACEAAIEEKTWRLLLDILKAGLSKEVGTRSVIAIDAGIPGIDIKFG
jgi:hypothetical protein